MLYCIYPIAPYEPAFFHLIIREDPEQHKENSIHGAGIFLVLYCIYPIVPYEPAFLHLIIREDLEQHRENSTPWYWKFSCVNLYLSDSTL